MREPQIMIGGDPELLRASGIPIAAGSLEVPCQRCGRTVLITEESQRLALGDAVRVVPFKLLKGGGYELTGPPEMSEGAPAVLCLWCAFADRPDVLELLPAKT